jgi:hypothetical protein
MIDASRMNVDRELRRTRSEEFEQLLWLKALNALLELILMGSY